MSFEASEQLKKYYTKTSKSVTIKRFWKLLTVKKLQKKLLRKTTIFFVFR